MDPHKETELFKTTFIVSSDNEKRKTERSHMNLRSPNGDRDLFTFGSSQMPSSSHQNGPNVAQQLISSSSNACSSHNTSNTADLDSRNKLEDANQSYESNKTNSKQCESLSTFKQFSFETDVPVTEASEKLNQRHKPCHERSSNNELNGPSTSGISKVSDNVPFHSVICMESRKRPSSLRLNKCNLDGNDSSSDNCSEYSLGSEDGCIYTYRGGEHLADLPSSFFSLDMGLPHDNHLPIPPHYNLRGDNPPVNNRGRESRASSPDQDFLEMDFDPGPSCEADTGDESSPDGNLEQENLIPDEEVPSAAREVTPEIKPPENVVSKTSHSCSHMHCHSVPSTSRGITAHGEGPSSSNSIIVYGKIITHVNAKGDRLLVRRTTSNWRKLAPVNIHSSSGDLISPRELLNGEEGEPLAHLTHQINQGTNMSTELSLYHLAMTKKLWLKKMAGFIENDEASTSVSEPKRKEDSEESHAVEPPTCMIWTEMDACERQVTQIATSACGATAVVNVFLALGLTVDAEKINAAIGTRLRAENAPLPRYLLSRSVAGCTAADLMTGIHRASDGQVTARFFPTYPERAFSLSHWLADWLSLGAIPILTLNLQASCEGEIPDAWHHQMVFGVSPRGVYLCNPVECVREETLWPRLTSPSVLLVRTRDILSRFTTQTDLTPLMFVPDRRYHTFNVLGQVVNVIREWRSVLRAESSTSIGHVRLPAGYQAGVTVAALTGSEAHRTLMHASQLPILAPQGHTHYTHYTHT